MKQPNFEELGRKAHAKEYRKPFIDERLMLEVETCDCYCDGCDSPEEGGHNQLYFGYEILKIEAKTNGTNQNVKWAYLEDVSRKFYVWSDDKKGLSPRPTK